MTGRVKIIILPRTGPSVIFSFWERSGSANGNAFFLCLKEADMYLYIILWFYVKVKGFGKIGAGFVQGLARPARGCSGEVQIGVCRWVLIRL